MPALVWTLRNSQRGLTRKVSSLVILSGSLRAIGASSPAAPGPAPRPEPGELARRQARRRRRRGPRVGWPYRRDHRVAASRSSPRAGWIERTGRIDEHRPVCSEGRRLSRQRRIVPIFTRLAGRSTRWPSCGGIGCGVDSLLRVGVMDRPARGVPGPAPTRDTDRPMTDSPSTTPQFDGSLRSDGSRVRYRVLAFTVALAAITYLDRVCIAQTAQDMMRDLGLSKEQMGFVFSAFTLAYALFEMPTGAWGDRIGTRRVLTRIVVWWSSFTIATAAAFNYASLLVVRFLFGMGEAGAFPNVSKTFSRWFPARRARHGPGDLLRRGPPGRRADAAPGPSLLDGHALADGLRAFGLVGFVWAVAWFRWFRDDPADHPAVSQAELKLIEAGRRSRAAPARRGGASAGSSRPEHDRALPDVLHPGVWVLLQHHLAADLPGEGARVLLDAARAAGGPAADPELGGRPDGGLTTDRAVRAYGLRVGRCGVGWSRCWSRAWP